jgi:betaine reductase
MARMRVLHYINQFFAGIGGEEKASTPMGVLKGPIGPGKRLESLLKNSAEVVVTVYCGDDYFVEHQEEVLTATLNIAREHGIEVVISGPAFLAGRYGFACVEICHFLGSSGGYFGISAMSKNNPAVLTYKQHKDRRTYIFPTSDGVTGMEESLSKIASFVSKLAQGEGQPLASEDGYIKRGIRVPLIAHKSGAKRTIDLLLEKIVGSPFVSEIPFEIPEVVVPAPPIANLQDAQLALASTAGVHAAGNPYGFKAMSNTQWKKYPIGNLNSMTDTEWCVIHGGTSTSYMSENPNFAVPLDVCKKMEKDGVFKQLYPYFYATTGVAASVPRMESIGKEIAIDMKRDGVNGVLLVST